MEQLVERAVGHLTQQEAADLLLEINEYVETHPGEDFTPLLEVSESVAMVASSSTEADAPSSS